MRTILFTLIVSLLCTAAHADQVVRLSVKVVKATDGTRPSGGVADEDNFDDEITHGNWVLANTGRGYRLQVLEFVDIQPPVPAGEANDYWFSIDSRINASRDEMQAAALADKTSWRWDDTAINIYINDDRSGVCSFPVDDQIIMLGKTLFGSTSTANATGTVLHEVGHYFDLRHTHRGDRDQAVGDWRDGDGLSETLNDDPDASRADINNRYPNETQAKRDDLWFNVMSYHQEDRLIPAQMDIWDETAMNERSAVIGRRTWHVSTNANPFLQFGSPALPYATITQAQSSAATSVGYLDDGIQLTGGQDFAAPSDGRIDVKCVITSSGGEARIVGP